MEKQAQLHTIAPVYDENSRILILGSFPSVKSREAAFFYGHPQNRFWRVLAAVLGEETPQTTAEKKSLLLRHGVALWDVIASCDIAGSSDASITNVVHRAGPPHLLQRRHGLPLLPPVRRGRMGKGGGSALHQSRQRALVRAGAHRALARGARAVALTAPRR